MVPVVGVLKTVAIWLFCGCEGEAGEGIMAFVWEVEDSLPEVNGGGSDGGGRCCSAVVMRAVRESCLALRMLNKFSSRESSSCCWLSSLVLRMPICSVKWRWVDW